MLIIGLAHAWSVSLVEDGNHQQMYLNQWYQDRGLNQVHHQATGGVLTGGLSRLACGLDFMAPDLNPHDLYY